MAVASWIIHLYFPVPLWLYVIETFLELYIVKKLIGFTHGVCRSDVRLDGKTVIITGSSSGIGLEAARDLAKRGAKLYMAIPDVEAAQVIRDEMAASVGNDQIFVRFLDLTSLKSVHNFAEEFRSIEPRLDILINNAGMGSVKKSWTDEGLERQMTCNHLGHFLLTSLLIDMLKVSSPSRVVCTSSMLHQLCRRLDLDDLRFQEPGSGEGVLEIYAASKTCNILFVRELARRLEGTGVTAYAVHPGTINTSFLSHFPWYFRWFTQLATQMVVKTTKEGAQPIIHAAVSEELHGKSGLYLADCKVANPSRLARDADMAKRLWETSEELTGIKDRKKSQ